MLSHTTDGNNCKMSADFSVPDITDKGFNDTLNSVIHTEDIDGIERENPLITKIVKPLKGELEFKKHCDENANGPLIKVGNVVSDSDSNLRVKVSLDDTNKIKTQEQLLKICLLPKNKQLCAYEKGKDLKNGFEIYQLKNDNEINHLKYDHEKIDKLKCNNLDQLYMFVQEIDMLKEEYKQTVSAYENRILLLQQEYSDCLKLLKPSTEHLAENKTQYKDKVTSFRQEKDILYNRENKFEMSEQDKKLIQAEYEHRLQVLTERMSSMMNSVNCHM